MGNIPSSQSRGHDMAAKWQPLSTDSTDPPLNPPLDPPVTSQIGRMAGSSLQNVGVGCQLHMKIAQRFALLRTGPARPTKSFLSCLAFGLVTFFLPVSSLYPCRGYIANSQMFEIKIFASISYISIKYRIYYFTVSIGQSYCMSVILLL